MASPFGTIAVIADPRAGVMDQLPVLERALEERGLEHRTYVANGTDPSALATAPSTRDSGSSSRWATTRRSRTSSTGCSVTAIRSRRNPSSG